MQPAHLTITTAAILLSAASRSDLHTKILQHLEATDLLELLTRGSVLRSDLRDLIVETYLGRVSAGLAPDVDILEETVSEGTNLDRTMDLSKAPTPSFDMGIAHNRTLIRESDCSTSNSEDPGAIPVTAINRVHDRPFSKRKMASVLIDKIVQQMGPCPKTGKSRGSWRRLFHAKFARELSVILEHNPRNRSLFVDTLLYGRDYMKAEFNMRIDQSLIDDHMIDWRPNSGNII